MRVRQPFFLILFAAGAICPPLFAADSEVTGTFSGDGKAAKIANVSTVRSG